MTECACVEQRYRQLMTPHGVSSRGFPSLDGTLALMATGPIREGRIIYYPAESPGLSVKLHVPCLRLMRGKALTIK